MLLLQRLLAIFMFVVKYMLNSKVMSVTLVRTMHGKPNSA